MLKNRRSHLARLFEDHSLDCILFTNLHNIRYLCGFTGTEGALLLTRDRGWFLCDSRYTTQASGEVWDAEVREFTAKLETIAALVKEHGFSRMGFEAAHTTVAFFKSLSTALAGHELVALGGELDDIRCCKDADELQRLSEVAALSSAALMAIRPLLKPGVKEAEVALELEMEMRRRGADGRAFDFIVASGVRGAMPHGIASGKALQAGELVTIDFGAVKDGYYSDETVTVAIGDLDERQRAIHEIVRTAHDMAIAAVKPGIPCKELDAVAREYIRECGYGDYFGHGLGHGVGLEIHEKPVLSPRSEAVAAEGMVFTIEPGIYIPGFGGVRIEDTVAVTAGGCRVLTGTPKDLYLL
ncbi:aminopeptidase P family protein [Geobacter sp. FeAm09]|uniref:M24 family metallopeptidase n=1 Tax=Geobacter sp. FeAm09 TaxID=2597769 RepID=UPI0011ED86A3|nr:Xaa-Pro peptidase family protein [Geobacter sp. FeAm09]QEM68644.1 aminopeptidase P family protein [Geobacter sp. FeAm09]